MFTNFSSLLKLTRTVAWVLRFINNARKKKRKEGELKADELTAAEHLIFRITQREVYLQEIELLRQKKPLPKSCSLHQLTPYLADDGLLRVYGRIDAAYCLPLAARAQ